MASAAASLPWFDQTLHVGIRLGEVTLWESRTEGWRWHPDIFSTPPLETPRPLIAELADGKAPLALLYSFPVAPTFPSVTFSRGRVAVVDKRFQHYYVDTGAGFEAYLQPRNKKTVSTLRRKARKVESMSPDGRAFRVHRLPAEMDAFLDIALPVSERSYQYRLLGQGLPMDPGYRAQLRAMAERNEVVAYTLHLGERAIAYTVCPIYGGNRALYDHTGFDPDFAEYSPGAVLQFRIVEDLCARQGVDFYDLCTGEGRHKETFATGAIECANIFIFPVLSRHSPLFALRWTFDATTALAARLLARFGIKGRLKRLIRRSA